MSKSKHVAVVGAGLMGHGIAQVFASKGDEVFLYDADKTILKRAKEKIQRNLMALSEIGLVSREEITTILAHIRLTRGVKEAVSGARFVIEAVPENLTIKQNLFKKMELFCSPITILATHTSGIPISQIAAKIKRKERVVGARFGNPPYLIPLVEVAGGRDTSTDVVDYTYRLLKCIGKIPVKICKDVPGGLTNRLQHTIWREVISSVEKDIADPQIVDEVIKSRFAIRLSAAGSHTDSTGLDHTPLAHDSLLPCLDGSAQISSILFDKQSCGELGQNTETVLSEWDRTAIDTCSQKLRDYLVRWIRMHQQEEKQELKKGENVGIEG
ncbi:MAG: 3-hydroxyacyl-CoA dehydrogenase family protein [Desulfatitalea sp.]|nr:hypothetical protein [Desulfatitalea sp.]NNK02303.1 3-hydroxyacyl-CoA dehydrogenase family protein [Desulfatitalea sp.]